LKLEQRAINGEESFLCTLGATRWNSICDAAKCFQESNKPIRSLIFMKRDILESIPKTQRHKEKVKYLFEQFESQSFWEELNVSIELMSPSALCVDWTQSNNATMSQTVASLLYFYHFYFNHCSGVYMLQCIGRCWNYLNKQAYFVAYFLDLKFFITGIKVDWFSLSTVVDELYTQVFRVVPVNLLSEISIYKKMDNQQLQL